MRKVIAILLTICLSVGLCACGSNSEYKETASKNVTLTSENITDFLNIKINHYEEGNEEYAKVKIYPIQPGSFSSTRISLKLEGEMLSVKDIVGEKYYTATIFEKYVVDLVLPASGSHEFIVVLFRGEIEKYEFQSVSGTFISN